MYRLERILLLKSVCRQLKSTSLTSSSSSSQFIVTRSVSSEILHTIPGLVQSCVVWWHTSTGLPWWATFATSTLIARSALIPLVVHQRKSADKMAGSFSFLSLVSIY